MTDLSPPASSRSSERAQAGERSILRPTCAVDFLAKAFPSRGILLTPWLPEKGLAMVAGPRGLGKTHVGLNVAYAIASGGAFLGWKAPAPRRVIYLDGEMPGVTLQERLAQIVQHAPIRLSPNALAFLVADDCANGLPDLSTYAGQSDLRPILDTFDVIVLDNLSTLCRSGRENDADSWTQMQAFALELRRAGKSVIFVHHTGKTGAQPGTSRREDVLDSVLVLKRPPDYESAEGARFIVHFDKHRGFFGADAEPFEARLNPDTGEWSASALTSTRDADILALKAEGLSARDIAERIDMSKSAVDRALQRLKASAD